MCDLNNDAKEMSLLVAKMRHKLEECSAAGQQYVDLLMSIGVIEEEIGNIEMSLL